MFCSACGAKVAETARFCSRCGSGVGADADETLLGDTGLLGGVETLAPDDPVAPAGTTPRRVVSAILQTPGVPRSRTPSHATLSSSSDPIGGGRFAPGSIVAERYRIVALLGKGGMGEVYRAEDLRLTQVLAMKFLPAALSQDASALSRFHSEVRVARQVSHPNVCRMFDIGDAEGLPFLTMEYVDGEDLSSLIRRIGRLPQDKAIEIARQICAGLAAAHERGVVHRDLKPANIMLDGAGKARITDFGLAGIAANIQGAEVRAGTPAYMAPEQLAGKEVTAKSDIYSLGLVMYELLTGKRAFDAASLPELMKARTEGKITNPSTLVRDLDPLVERVILRCLENEPGKRPATALQVAAALPGGDPLAAALAAGETPSPEMVAAAGEKEATPAKIAVAGFVAALVLLAGCVVLGNRESGLKYIRMDNSGEILKHQARQIIADIGYSAAAKDAASGFSYDDDYLDYLEKKEKPGLAWPRILAERPVLLHYWYRQSPRIMLPAGYANFSLTPGVVAFDDPPQRFSGMVNLQLDPEGRLTYFQAIPPEKEDAGQTTQPVDWKPLFAAAGLHASELHAVTPIWNSLASPDTREAWEGTWPGTARRLHVEAAAWHGKPVYFQMAGDWTVAKRMKPEEAGGSERAGQIFGVTFSILLVFGGIWLAHRNHARGKGDRRGAWTLAKVGFALEMILFFVRVHLTFSSETLYLVMLASATGMFLAGFFWVLYLALEPYVRSKWPQTIVSWTRLLGGKWRDPMVGRDILFGTVLGLAWTMVYFAGYAFDVLLGEQPMFGQTVYFDGIRETASNWLGNILVAMFGALLFFFVLVVLRVVVRNRWLAAALFVVLFATPKILGSSHPLIDGPVWVAIYAISAFAVVRFGLVVLAAASFAANVLLNVPYTVDFSKWYAPNVMVVISSFAALATWAYFTSLAGQKVLKDELFE
jgi:serine/threonine-protein kinase